MSPETQLEILRQRMAGNKEGAEEFRRKVLCRLQTLYLSSSACVLKHIACSYASYLPLVCALSERVACMCAGARVPVFGDNQGDIQAVPHLPDGDRKD